MKKLDYYVGDIEYEKHCTLRRKEKNAFVGKEVEKQYFNLF